MNLREVIRSEVLSDEPTEIRLEELDVLVKEIIDNYWWCLSHLDLNACRTYDNIIKNLIDSLGKVRLYKYLLFKEKRKYKAFDSKHINTFLSLVSKIYELYLKGYVDTEDSVLVYVKSNFKLNDTKLNEGSITSLDIFKALLLEILGVVEVLMIQ